MTITRENELNVLSLTLNRPEVFNSFNREKTFIGFTAYKAFFKCHICQEPFDYFKCLT